MRKLCHPNRHARSGIGGIDFLHIPRHGVIDVTMLEDAKVYHSRLGQLTAQLDCRTAPNITVLGLS